eukprot:3810069-Pyramimonas_sp.AAC.1
MPPCYHTNPIVQAKLNRGEPPPVPIALFADGVRYTATLAGRADSILGMWIRTLKSQKRHLLCSIRVNRMCRCGCRGWCTLHPVWAALAHGFRGLALGRRPRMKWDGTPRQPDDPFSVELLGEDLGFSAVLLFMTGPWVHGNIGRESGIF